MLRCEATTGERLTADSIKENNCAFFSTIFRQHPNGNETPSALYRSSRIALSRARPRTEEARRRKKVKINGLKSGDS
jgi:hypothetical protein